MAHQSTQSSEIDEIAEQQQIREQARRLFGREPESVRFQPIASSLHGLLCFVRIRFGIGEPVEFIFANRALLGVPPKRQW